MDKNSSLLWVRIKPFLNSCNIPLRVHRKVSPCLQDTKVLLRERIAIEWILWAIFRSHGSFGRRLVLFESGERCITSRAIPRRIAIAIPVIGLLVIPMCQVWIRFRVHVVVGQGLLPLRAGVVFRFRSSISHEVQSCNLFGYVCMICTQPDVVIRI